MVLTATSPPAPSHIREVIHLLRSRKSSFDTRIWKEREAKEVQAGAGGREGFPASSMRDRYDVMLWLQLYLAYG